MVIIVTKMLYPANPESNMMSNSSNVFKNQPTAPVMTDSRLAILLLGKNAFEHLKKIRVQRQRVIV